MVLKTKKKSSLCWTYLSPLPLTCLFSFVRMVFLPWQLRDYLMMMKNEKFSSPSLILSLHQQKEDEEDRIKKEGERRKETWEKCVDCKFPQTLLAYTFGVSILFFLNLSVLNLMKIRHGCNEWGLEEHLKILWRTIAIE